MSNGLLNLECNKAQIIGELAAGNNTVTTTRCPKGGQILDVTRIRTATENKFVGTPRDTRPCLICSRSLQARTGKD